MNAVKGASGLSVALLATLLLVSCTAVAAPAPAPPTAGAQPSTPQTTPVGSVTPAPVAGAAGAGVVLATGVA